MARASIRFSTPSRPSACAPRSAPVGLAEDDLEHDGLGARVVARVRIGEEVDLLEVRLAEPGEQLLVGPGHGHRRSEDADDRGTLRAPEAGVPAGEYVGHDPALPVRRPGQRDEGPLAGDVVLDFHGVADGEDVRVAGAHLLVDTDAAPLTDLQPGRLGERGLRTHADGQYHDVRGIPLARLGKDLEGAGGGLLEGGHGVVESEMDVVLFQMALDEAGTLRVERRHDLIEHLDDGHLESAVDQVLGHLQADVSAAHHHGLPRLVQGSGIRTTWSLRSGRWNPARSTPGSLSHRARSARRRCPAGRSPVAAGGWEPPRARARACRRSRWSPRRWRDS